MKYIAAALLVVVCATSVRAEVFEYVCRDGGKSYGLRVDDTRNVLEWKGVTYRIEQSQDCAKYGWRAEKAGTSFDFCTATKGYADFRQNGTEIQCNLKRETASSQEKPAESVSSEKLIAACSTLGDSGDVTPAQLNCLRASVATAEQQMIAAYRWRLGVTDASHRRDLASVQKLWTQSMQANCDFFGGNPGSAARLECRIKAMVERKDTLQALD